MSGYKLARSISQRVGTGDNRKTFKMATNVFGKLFDRAVATCGILAQRHQENIVEVSAQLSVVKHGRRCRVIDPARSFRLGLTDYPGDFICSTNPKFVRTLAG